MHEDVHYGVSYSSNPNPKEILQQNQNKRGLSQ